MLGGRIVHERLEQETVLLCLWQRIGPLVLDRVLRRQHHERIGQGKLLTLETDAPLLHRLEQRGLDFCRGAVDLVRQQDIGEHRTLPNAE